MKLYIVFIITCTVGTVLSQCSPSCTNNQRCLKDYESGTYSCITVNCKGNAFNQYGIARDYGHLRKCREAEPPNCKGSNTKVEFPYQCCSGIAFQQFTDLKMTKCSLVCDHAVRCDASEGCGASIHCPGVEECIDNKCVIPKEGVQCGACGKAPINGRCCGEGIHDNGICSCSSGSSACTGEADCVGTGNGHMVCCDGKCKKDSC
jgi:hypothetical protein